MVGAVMAKYSGFVYCIKTIFAIWLLQNKYTSTIYRHSQ